MAEKIDKFPCLRQTTTNGCWIACAVMIWNYLNPRSLVSIAKTKQTFDLSKNGQGSAVELLGKMYGWNEEEYIDHIPVDTYAIPTLEEIQDQIQKKKPFLCCVAAKKPHNDVSHEDPYGRYECQTEVEDGHWVIIIGVKNRKLIIVDPCDGKEHNVPYDAWRYIKNAADTDCFWQSSSYIDI